jgi:hypothetical protein
MVDNAYKIQQLQYEINAIHNEYMHNCDLYIEGYAGGSKFNRYQNRLQREIEKRKIRISKLEHKMLKIRQ